MICSRCGYKAKDIGALGKHYRKNHPKVMARKKAEGSSTKKKWMALGKKKGWI